MSKPCGCAITRYIDGLSDELGPERIEYCPLHASAGEMLTLLKESKKVVEDAYAPLGDNLKALVYRIKKIISRAEGKES